jgi:hypothetical protein
MECALWGTGASAGQKIEICQPCHATLLWPMRSTGVEWGDAITAATAPVRASASPAATARMVCSFCPRPGDQVKKLLAGHGGTFICDGRVDFCRRILESEP